MILRTSGNQAYFIPEIPDRRRFLRCDQKNRNHFYFEGTVPDIPDVSDFYNECEPGCPKNCNSHKNPSIGKSYESPIITIHRTSGNQALGANQNIA